MADRPGSANRAMPVLSVMMRMADLWGYRPHNSNPCKNTRRYRTELKERFLTAEELARLNAVLARDAFWCPHIVAIVRQLMLTGCRLGEIVSLEWDWIRGKRIHLPDSKSGPRTVWLSSAARVFPEDLTSARLYTFWVGIREEAGLAELRIHDARYTYTSQGLMNGVGLATAGKLPGHRRRATTAIYAHLDDAALRDGVPGRAPGAAGRGGRGRDRPGRAGPSRSPRLPGLQTRRGGERGAAEAPPLPRPRQDLTAAQARLAPGPWSKAVPVCGTFDNIEICQIDKI